MAFLSKVVENAMIRKGMTQRETARKLGISEVRMSKIMNGQYQVRAEEMLILADLFDLEPAEIIKSDQVPA